MGDDSGKDYHRSNKFIEEDSRDFTDKYFNSKKCGIGSGIGGITMFGSNELIGGERKVALSGVYDFAGVWGDSDINGTTQAINQKRYKYFKDCVFEPVKRSEDRSNNTDFRVIKTQLFNNVNNKIININGILDRFNTNILFNTYKDPTADYSKRISASSIKSPSDTDTTEIPEQGGITYKSLITGDDNKTKLKRIQPISDTDNINDKMYTELLTIVNNDRTMNLSARQRQLEIYAKVYEFRKKLDSIFANMRAQSKDDASLMYTIRIGESVVQELRTILSYLAVIQRTNDIILFEKNVGTSKNGIYNMKPINLPPTGELGAIPNIDNNDNKSKITGVNNNIFKIPLEDDTYNNNDEKRYVYGITYYFDTSNSKQTDA